MTGTGESWRIAGPGVQAADEAPERGGFAVPGDGGLSRDGCVRALQQRREGPLPLQGIPQGATVCLVTHAENIAGLRIAALPTVGSPQITFDHVVWA